ncbi:MAG: hypothetical protein WC044_09810 [Crocinitomicaceae bacterium]
MDIFLQILIAVIPAAIVFLTTALFLKKQEEREVRRMQVEMSQKKKATNFLSERMEAYQRSVLLLERIHPNSLVMRIHNPALPAMVFQSELIKAVREEFEHNVTQQLFISIEAWHLLKNAKDETVKIINVAGKQMNDTSMSTDLAAKIFEIVGEVGQLPSEIAVEYVKKEFQELF